MTPRLVLAAALVPLASSQSTFYGYDAGTGELLRSSTGAASGALEGVGAPGVSIDALDFDVSGRHLWATATIAGASTTGRVDLATGEFVVRVGAATQPRFDDVSASPEPLEWYACRRVGADLEVWSGDMPRDHVTLAATFPGLGDVDRIATDRDGVLFGYDRAAGALVRLDVQASQASPVGTLGVTGAEASGLDFDWLTGELFTVLVGNSGAPRLATIDTTTGAATLVDSMPVTSAGLRLAVQRSVERIDDRTYCDPAVPNATGLPGRLQVVGSGVIPRNDVVLEAYDVTPGTFGLFLVSPEVGAPVQPVNSVGDLCLRGPVARFAPGGSPLQTGLDGRFRARLDLDMIPTPGGSIVAEAWGTWRFQAWYRDSSGGSATSNLTNASEVVLSQPTEGNVYGNPSLLAHEARRIEIADWDLDGFRDVVLLQRGHVQTLPFERDGVDAQAIEWGDSISAFRFYHRITDIGDLDGDGDPDAIAVTDVPQSYSVLWWVLNRGDGTFAANFPNQQSTCFALADARIADMDADGFADVVYGCEGSLRYGVLYGDANGLGAAHQEFVLGRRTTQVLHEDRDGNGLQDIILVHRFTGNATLILQTAPRTFVQDKLIDLVGNPTSATLADINEDGISDMVVAAENPNDLSVLFGRSSGRFRDPVSTSEAPQSPGAVATVDVNADGWLDVLVAEHFDDTLAVYYNDRVGGLDPPVRTPIGREGADIATADLDDDGVLEAFVTHDDTPAVVAVDLDPFELESVPTKSPVPFDHGVELGDVDGDGALDAFVWSTSGASVSLGDGNGGFGPAVTQPGLAFNALHPQNLVDVDGDGDLDFVARQGLGTPAALVSRNDGSGAFAPIEVVPLAVTPRYVEVGDLDGDGLPELVSTPTSGPGVEVVWNVDGSFGAGVVLPLDGRWFSAAIGDLDLDGIGDLAVSYTRSTSAGQRTDVFYGTGAQSLEPATTASSTVGLTGSFQPMKAVDVDRDGRLDLFLAPTIDYLRNEGARTFSVASSGDRPESLGSFNPEHSIEVDFNGDGWLDSVALIDPQFGSADSLLYLCDGRPDGTFDVRSILPLPARGSTFQAYPSLGDLDGDGAPELVVLGTGADAGPSLRVWRWTEQD